MKTATPELDKLSKVSGTSQRIGEFIEWLGEQEIVLAQYHKHEPEDEPDPDPDHEDQEIGCYRAAVRGHRPGLYWERSCGFADNRLYPAQTGGIERLLARYFKIDLAKIDNEKRALLDEIRATA